MGRMMHNKILEAIAEGKLTAQIVAESCLAYMSEDEIADMAHCNAFFEHEDEEEEVTFKCESCRAVLPVDEMSTDPKSEGWCVECDEHEKEACRKDALNDRDGAPTGWGDDSRWDD